MIRASGRLLLNRGGPASDDFTPPQVRIESAVPLKKCLAMGLTCDERLVPVCARPWAAALGHWEALPRALIRVARIRRHKSCAGTTCREGTSRRAALWHYCRRPARGPPLYIRGPAHVVGANPPANRASPAGRSPTLSLARTTAKTRVLFPCD